jgi:hypothetical protein
VGGRPSRTGMLNEAYSSKDGTNFNKLASLPRPTVHPCLVIVDNETLFMAGGLVTDPNQGVAKSYIYTKTR